MADSVLSQSTATPSAGQEQAFLEGYFQCLSKFAYDKAKEITVRRVDVVPFLEEFTNLDHLFDIISND